MGLVQAWSARFPGLELFPLPGTEFRALADSHPDVPSVPDQDGPINHRRVTYVPRVPDSSVGLAAHSRWRRGANAPVPSAAPSGRLRCQHRGGTRSRTYHCRHYRDPIAYPVIGVCSRHWTGCANMKMSKEQSTMDGGTMDHLIVESPGWVHALDPKWPLSREKLTLIILALERPWDQDM
jgi:hypothetical protein